MADDDDDETETEKHETNNALIGQLARSQHSIDDDVNALTRKVEDLDPSNH